MWYIILLLIKSPLSIIAEPVKTIDTTPSRVLLMFPASHHVVVHYENKTSYLVNTIFAEGFEWIVYFVNHDISQDFLRPSSNSVLNLVILDNQMLFLRYSWTDYNVEQEDTVFFIEENLLKPNHTVPIWKASQEMIIWTNALIYILDEGKLFYACYCCGSKSGIAQEINISQVPDLLKTFRICYDFNKMIFNVAYITYEPFFWCK